MPTKGHDRSAYQKDYWSKYKKKKKRSQPRISLSEAEHKLFSQIASQEKTSISKLIKNMAIAYQQESFLVPQVHTQKIDEFIHLIRNIANNINQIAHNSNTIKSVVNENRVFEQLKNLEDQFEAFITNPYQKKRYDDS